MWGASSSSSQSTSSSRTMWGESHLAVPSSAPVPRRRFLGLFPNPSLSSPLFKSGQIRIRPAARHTIVFCRPRSASSIEAPLVLQSALRSGEGVHRELGGARQPNVHASAETLRTLPQERSREPFRLSKGATSVRERKTGFASSGHFAHFAGIAQLTGRHSNLRRSYLASQTCFEVTAFWLTAMCLKRWPSHPERETGTLTAGVSCLGRGRG